MRLAKTFRYATLSVIVVVFIFAVIVSNVFFSLYQSIQVEKQLRQIQNSVYDFYSLVIDHVQHPENPIPLLQWKAAYDQLDMLIVRARAQSPRDEDRGVFLAIQNNLRQMNHLFPRFSDIGRRPNPSGLPSSVILEQMKLQAFRILNLTNQMKKKREDSASTLIQISMPTIIAFLLLVIAFTATAILWARACVLRPLKALQTGAERIWEGDLGYRLELLHDDEIGYLARTLNLMMDYLLELQKKIAVEAEEKLRAQHEILDIQEMERKRIGQDLHDSIAQRLAGISFMAQGLLNKLLQRNASEVSDLQSLTEEIKKTLEETRQLAHGFHPIDLQHSGLAPALRNFAKTVSSAFQVDCVFSCPEDFSMKDPDIEAHLYRITQEAVHNAIRHGNAKEIRVTLGKHLSEVVLEVADNGKSFTPGNAETEKGIGFKSMRYRAALIHGHLSVEAHKNHGTRITVRCPLKLSHPHPVLDTTFQLNSKTKKDPLL